MAMGHRLLIPRSSTLFGPGDCMLILKQCGIYTSSVMKTFLVRRCNKTQKYKGAQFEQLESGWA